MIIKNWMRLIYILMITLGIATNVMAAPAASDMYFEIRIYHYSNSQQEALIDNFVKSNFIPYLHSNGVGQVGVFKAIANDTAVIKKMVVLIPFKSIKHWEKYVKTRPDDPAITSTVEYTAGTTAQPSYNRMETIFLKAFKFTPKISSSKLSSPKSERVYELRSYESASEKLHVNKVHMFNEGGEVDLFNRLGFNAVFYGSVVHGAKMPNLMYMTSFENMKARTEHWAAFSSHPDWKILSSKPEYQKNVSKIDITFLRPTEYSEL